MHKKLGIQRKDSIDIKFDRNTFYEGMKKKYFKKIIIIGSDTMSLKKPIDFMNIMTSKVQNMPGLPTEFFMTNYEEIGQFKRFPKAAYAIYQSILNEYTHEKPTKAHHFIKMLHEQGMVRAYLTNAIDMLDRQVGFNATDYNYIDDICLGPMCANCEKDYPLDVWVPELKSGNSVSECKDCKGPIKPRVNFLNLALNDKVFKKFE